MQPTIFNVNVTDGKLTVVVLTLSHEFHTFHILPRDLNRIADAVKEDFLRKLHDYHNVISVHAFHVVLQDVLLVRSSNGKVLTHTRHFLSTQVVFSRVRTRHIGQASQIRLIGRHIRGSRVLMAILQDIPRNITQAAKQRRSRQLMRKRKAHILLKRNGPGTVRTGTYQFQHGSMHRRTQRSIAQVTATTMVLTGRRLGTHKADPAIGVSRRGRTGRVIKVHNVSLTVTVVINFNSSKPYSHTA